jgi:hypothetical protein
MLLPVICPEERSENQYSSGVNSCIRYHKAGSGFLTTAFEWNGTEIRLPGYEMGHSHTDQERGESLRQRYSYPSSCIRHIRRTYTRSWDILRLWSDGGTTADNPRVQV